MKAVKEEERGGSGAMEERENEGDGGEEGVREKRDAALWDCRKGDSLQCSGRDGSEGMH